MNSRRFTVPAAIVSCVLVAALATVLGAAGAAAHGDLTPTPSGAAPITVVIPGTASPSASSTPRPSGSPSEDLDTESPDGNSCAASPGQVNADGSPVPAGAPASDAVKLTVDDDRVAADGWVIATASGFLPAELAQVVLYQGAVVIGSYTVGDDGVFTARFRIPEDTPTGTHVVEVTGWTSWCVASAELTVVAGGPGGPGGSAVNWLSLWWVYVVLAALFVGLLSLVLTFRGSIASWFVRAPSRGPVT